MVAAPQGGARTIQPPSRLEVLALARFWWVWNCNVSLTHQVARAVIKLSIACPTVGWSKSEGRREVVHGRIVAKGGGRMEVHGSPAGLDRVAS